MCEEEEENKEEEPEEEEEEVMEEEEEETEEEEEEETQRRKKKKEGGGGGGGGEQQQHKLRCNCQNCCSVQNMAQKILDNLLKLINPEQFTTYHQLFFNIQTLDHVKSGIL